MPAFPQTPPPQKRLPKKPQTILGHLFDSMSRASWPNVPDPNTGNISAADKAPPPPYTYWLTIIASRDGQGFDYFQGRREDQWRFTCDGDRGVARYQDPSDSWIERPISFWPPETAADVALPYYFFREGEVAGLQRIWQFAKHPEPSPSPIQGYYRVYYYMINDPPDKPSICLGATERTETVV